MTNKSIYVLEGTYRNRPIENTQFELVKAYQPYPHKEGGFVTVKIQDLAQYQAPKDIIRISVDSESKLRDRPPAQPKDETDEEVIERMRKRFDILTDMTKATKRGDVRAMIVSGPPGVVNHLVWSQCWRSTTHSQPWATCLPSMKCAREPCHLLACTVNCTTSAVETMCWCSMTVTPYCWTT